MTPSPGNAAPCTRLEHRPLPWEWAMGCWELVGLGVVCLAAGRYWCGGGGVCMYVGGDAVWAPAG